LGVANAEGPHQRIDVGRSRRLLHEHEGIAIQLNPVFA